MSARTRGVHDNRERKNNNKSGLNGVLVLVTFMAFILVFTYMSLNLKNIDFGYEMQELLSKERLLTEEIDKLKSQKAQLLNLKRVEQLVIEKLGYQYPEPDQFIKVYED
jgi:cell division protein FtsL